MRFCIKNWVMHLDGNFLCFTKNCLTTELFFFYIKKKKISKIQLGKLGQSTSVYRYFYAILQRAAFWKGNKTQPTNQHKKTNHKSQEPLDCLILHFLLYFLVQKREAVFMLHPIFYEWVWLLMVF